MCAAILGGNWNNDVNAGVSYWNLNNASSNANVNIGRQTLIGCFSNYTPSSSPLGENEAAKSRGW